MPKAIKGTEILHKANDLINGDRASEYGSATENFGRIAAIWSQILKRTVTEEEVILCMIGLKMARLVNTPTHEDSWVDIAGYVGCWGKVQAGG